MGRELTALSPIVAEVFAEADRVMTPVLEKPLTSFIFIDDEDTLQAEMNLMQTAITQPAVLTLDIAMLRLLQAYGFQPDIVVGHSLGEYAALIAAGVMRFTDALEAAAARGSEMSKVSVADNGWMAAVLAPFDVVEDVLRLVDGYVVPANINSHKQCVIGGESKAVEQALQLFTERGYKSMQIPVSHAFHTRIVASASAPLRQVLDRFPIMPPQLPLVANVTGDFYPTTANTIKDMLQLQIASPVQWVKGLETLYGAGVRTFVEVGPKRALKGFADDVFSEVPEVLSLLTNHPKTGELPSFNQALCGLYAAGYFVEPAAVTPPAVVTTPAHEDIDEVDMANVTQMLVQAIQQASAQSRQPQAFDRDELPRGSVVISGTGLGLPGAEKALMDPDNAARILHGEQFIDLIPERFRKKMLAKHVTRLV
ncbi:MAG: acyltransferase domain-containing protein, partial [Anaerolineae bacterium]